MKKSPFTRLAKVLALLCAAANPAWAQQGAAPPADALEPDYAAVAADARKIADEIEKRQIGRHMQDGQAKLTQTDGAAGHLKIEEARVDLEEMISFCESTSGNAQKACRFKLKLSMGLNPGDTLGQMSKGSRPGTGQLGAAGQGASGQSGGRSPFAVFGPDSLGGPTHASSKLGNVKSKSSSLASGDPDPLAGNIEELGAAKNNDLQFRAGSSGRVMEEYRNIIEQYFKRLAEEEN